MAYHYCLLEQRSIQDSRGEDSHVDQFMPNCITMQPHLPIVKITGIN